MQRVAILGSPGSGKSTLARRLGAVLDLPVFHIDKLYWKPDWAPSGQDALRRKISKIVRQDRWIIDGNFSDSLDLRLPRCDTIILLERSRLTCLWRAFRRWLEWRGRSRPDLPDGCPETLDPAFYRYIIDFPREQGPRTREAIARLGGDARLIVLRTNRDADAVLAVARPG